MLLDDTDVTDASMQALAARLPASGFEVTPWYRLSDFYNKTLALFGKQIGVMRIIIGFIIVLLIVNTMTMAVAERTSEIGTAMALGARRTRILHQFVAVGGARWDTATCRPGGLALAPAISAIGIPMWRAPGTGAWSHRRHPRHAADERRKRAGAGVLHGACRQRLSRVEGVADDRRAAAQPHRAILA